jgi:hypothetical protein
MKWVRRHKTEVRGISYIVHDDGSRTYIARWKEARRLIITNPLTMRRRTIRRRAATFEEACRLKAAGEAAARKSRRPPSAAEEAAERVMAAEWFEYWVRQ